MTIIVFLTAVTLVAATPGVVVITPLGSHAGDFCRNDRALLFEDPTGVRVLWDPGRTIAGESDDRLGDIHVLVLSSVHSDHIGEVKKNSASPNLCGPRNGVGRAEFECRVDRGCEECGRLHGRRNVGFRCAENPEYPWKRHRRLPGRWPDQRGCCSKNRTLHCHAAAGWKPDGAVQ